MRVGTSSSPSKARSISRCRSRAARGIVHGDLRTMLAGVVTESTNVLWGSNSRRARLRKVANSRPSVLHRTDSPPTSACHPVFPAQSRPPRHTPRVLSRPVQFLASVTSVVVECAKRIADWCTDFMSRFSKLAEGCIDRHGEALSLTCIGVLLTCIGVFS